MSLNCFVGIARKIEICVVSRVCNRVLVGKHGVFDSQNIIVGKRIFYPHSEISAEAVLTVGAETLEGYEIVALFFNLPSGKAEATA